MQRKTSKRRPSPKTARSAKRKTAPVAIARHSIAYMVAVIGEVLRSTHLDVLDFLITLAISNANAATRNGSRVEPPRGISRNAVSRSLNVPLETVRRRVSALLKRRIIHERDDGLVVPDVSPLGALHNNAKLLALNAQTVRRLFQNLKAEGIALD